MEKFLLSELPTRLIQAGWDAPSYQGCYAATVDGHLADFATRERGRWYFHDADLAEIAGRLQLRRQAA